MTGKAVHFEIPIDDAKRGVTFYRRSFGWDLEQCGPLEYWTTSGGEGEGIGGALSMRAQADEGPIVYIEVADIDAALSTIESAGGRRVTERMPIPSVGYSAVFEDTEGNRLGLFQTDPSAAMPV